jgi:triphosphoribosyl-dephospho-CoA synthase
MKDDTWKEISRIGDAARLAAVLEASAHKPGNVTPMHDFSDTAYQDYLAGAIALGTAVEEAACRGYLAGEKEIAPGDIEIGELIDRGVSDVKASHKGGNTHLGTLMLFVPLAAAAGMCIASGKGFSHMRKNISIIIACSTKDDSKGLYKAIGKAKAGGLGKPKEKDVSFSRLMEESAEKDRIADELSGGMELLFDVGLPVFEKTYLVRKDAREAILGTYLVLLSRYPDTLVAKKKGKEKALEISQDAAKALAGELSLEEFDCKMRSKDNSLNPGTTADIVSGITFMWLLKRKVFTR